MTAIILAGGKSSRMRTDKAFIKIDNQPLIKRQIKLLKQIFKKIIIVTNSPNKSRSFCNMIDSLSKKGRDKYKFKDINPSTTLRVDGERSRTIKIVQDIIPDRGPLGGIYSGLLASKSFCNFVVACDMPFISLELIKYMYKKAAGFDIVMPKVKERYQPLCALYSKGCIATIKEALDKENLRIVDILPLLNVKLIDESEIKRFDPEFISFNNINTKEDYETVRS